MAITIQPVTASNVNEVLKLQVAQHQTNWIETISECLEEANENSNWRPVALYDVDLLIGFSMYGRFDDEGLNGTLWFDRLLIDERYQGKGYGKRCARAVLRLIFETYDDDVVQLSVYLTNTLAIALYESLGFRFNGEIDTKGERIMIISREAWNESVK